MTTTNGVSDARCSSVRRTAQKISSRRAASALSPTALARRVAISGPSSTPSSRRASLRMPSSGGSSSTIPAADWRISRSGQYVMPSPYGRHRPRRIRARPATAARNSATRRLLPTPGGPTTIALAGRRSAITRSNVACSASSSATRPMRGADSGTTAGSRSASIAMRRTAWTGSDLPLAAIARTGSPVAVWRTSRHVVSPTRISPAAAACSRRAAVFTASPVTRVCRAAGSPATTCPVWMPVRVAIDTPRSRTSSTFSPARASRISSAARTARTASSSWIVRRPKTAMIASPMNFSTVPPWRSRMAAIDSK